MTSSKQVYETHSMCANILQPSKQVMKMRVCFAIADIEITASHPGLVAGQSVGPSRQACSLSAMQAVAVRKHFP